MLLCKFALMVDAGESEWRSKTKGFASNHDRRRSSGTGAIHAVKYKEGARAGTFFARDNLSNFILWARSIGVDHAVIFEADDLVRSKSEKNVLYCLMEIARVQHGLEPPKLIQMERRLDSTTPHSSEPEDNTTLIAAIRQVLDENGFHSVHITDQGNGRFFLGDELGTLTIGLLHGHVMVRAGGSWDTLSNYLLTGTSQGKQSESDRHAKDKAAEERRQREEAEAARRAEEAAEAERQRLAKEKADKEEAERQAKLAKEKSDREEAARLAAEKNAKEKERLAAEADAARRAAEAEAKRNAEEKAKADAARKAAEDVAKRLAEEAKARAAADKDALDKERKARIAAEADAENERKKREAAEKAARDEADKRKLEEQARLQAEQDADAARQAAERLADEKDMHKREAEKLKQGTPRGAKAFEMGAIFSEDEDDDFEKRAKQCEDDLKRLGGPPIPAVLSAKKLPKVEGVAVIGSFSGPITDPSVAFLNDDVKAAREMDINFNNGPTLFNTHHSPVPRVVFSPIPACNRDYDDVRRYTDAVVAAVKRLISAGAKTIALHIQEIPADQLTQPELFEKARIASIIAALAVTYTPLECREIGKEPKVTRIAILAQDDKIDAEIKQAVAIEHGRAVARDIGGSDPERMAAPRVAEYVSALFKGTNIAVTVETDLELIKREYPLLAGLSIIY